MIIMKYINFTTITYCQINNIVRDEYNLISPRKNSF